MCSVASDMRLRVYGKSCILTLSPWNGLTVTEDLGLQLSLLLFVTAHFVIMILAFFFNRITSKHETPINYNKNLFVFLENPLLSNRSGNSSGLKKNPCKAAPLCSSILLPKLNHMWCFWGWGSSLAWFAEQLAQPRVAKVQRKGWARWQECFREALQPNVS